jgi:hypothetical protein
MGLFGGKKKDNSLIGMPPPMPGGQMPPPMGPIPPSQPYDQQNYSYQNDQIAMPEPQPQFQQPMPQQYSQEPKMSVEETVEAVIDEKWNDLLKDINKIIEWKERTDAIISRIQQEIEDLKNNFDSLNKSIMSKISIYDQNIRNVGVDIKAMEQVFQRILPKFTDNVNKLARITDKVSKK